jgi:PAS domain S-box-containing protein
MAESVGPEAIPLPGTLESDDAGEHAPAAGEAHLRMALDAAHMGTFDWDLDGGMLRWNSNHAEIFGLELDQFAGTWAAFVERAHPDDRQTLDDAVTRALQGGGDFEVEYRIVRPDGRIRWALSRGQVITDDAGAPTRVIGTTLDTTESRTVRENIARAFESIGDAFCAFDHSWRLTFANREAKRVLGGDEQRLLGHALLDVLPAALGTAHQRDYERALSDNLVVEFEAYHPGQAAWFEVRAYPSLDGLFVYFHDVTERRTAEAQRSQLLTAERETRATLDRMLSLTASLHAEDLSGTGVANLVCDAAIRTFDCPHAALWQLDGDTLRLLAEAPARGAGTPGHTVRIEQADHLRDLAGPEPAFLRHPNSPDPLVAPGRAGHGTPASLRVPVVIGTRVEALLVIAWDATRAPSTALLTVVQRFADQTALAIERARTREAQAEVSALSAQLQAGLLPTPSISDPHLAIHTRYQAGEHRLLLGGDFFDAVERSDGTFTVLIGDVSGHGADAAALGATLRAAGRGLSLLLPDPEGIVGALAAVLAAEHPTVETFATVCCAWVPPTRDQATFVVAGHPPPLLLSDHAERVDLPSGLPLGLGTRWTGTSVPLPPAWTLLFYTDGLIEARSDPGPGSDRFGEHGLLAHLAAQPEPASLDGSGLDALLSHVQRLSGERFADDVAVLLVRHHPDRDSPAGPPAAQLPPMRRPFPW